MTGQMNDIRDLVINDFFTPNIKAEVILDMMLTPYIEDLGELLRDVKGAYFVTKEMSIPRGDKWGSKGAKIDYVLAKDGRAGKDGTVFLVELKTAKSSVGKGQAKEYKDYCEGKKFGERLGRQLLEILKNNFKAKGFSLEINPAWGDKAPEYVFNQIMEKFGPAVRGIDRAAKARNLICKENWTQIPAYCSRKYLYTLGQLADYIGRGHTIWNSTMKVVYLTPPGAETYGFRNASLTEFAASLRERRAGEPYAQMLADIIRTIYGRNDRAELIIHRDSSQIGGCCTEISTGKSRILIDFGANLPGTDETAQRKDSEMFQQVFGTRKDSAVLFTHYHGDHYGLFKEIPAGIPMYIGPLAKNILRILAPYMDRDAEKKGLPVVERMNTYEAGKWLTPVPGIRVLPLYVDHSALDSYMFCVKVSGKTILFTGDFREHGIVGQKDRLRRVLKKYVSGPVDVLITEGTMLSRTGEIGNALVKSEQELGKEAGKLFQKHKYNFVLVSSTNLDSIMEFYHNTPEKLRFVCDLYQAQVMITAMRDMEKKGNFPQYKPSKRHPVVWVLGKTNSRWAKLREIGDSMKDPLWFRSVTEEELERDGFVLLVRKNTHPELGLPESFSYSWFSLNCYK